jgi:hypothetical protein
MRVVDLGAGRPFGEDEANQAALEPSEGVIHQQITPRHIDGELNESLL